MTFEESWISSTISKLTESFIWVEDSDGSKYFSSIFFEMTMAFNIFVVSCLVALYLWSINRQTHIRSTKGSIVMHKKVDFTSLEDNKRSDNKESLKLARKSLSASAIEPDEEDVLDEVPAPVEPRKIEKSDLSMSAERRVMLNVMAKIKLFSYLSEQAQLEILKNVEHVNLSKGDLLFDQLNDKFDGSFFAVISGKVKVTFHDFLVGLNDNYVEDTTMEGTSSDYENKNDDNWDTPLCTYYDTGCLVTPPLAMLSGLINHFKSHNWFSVIKNDDHNPLDYAGNVSAIAVQPNTCLIRIRPQCFADVLQKYPSEVYRLTQALLCRVQRVSILTLFQMLGLQTELLQWIGENNKLNGEVLGCPSAGLSSSLVKDISTDLKSNDKNKLSMIKRNACEVAAKHLGIPTEGEGVNLLMEFAKLESTSKGMTLIKAGEKHDNAYLLLSGSMDYGTMLPYHDNYKFKKLSQVAPGTLVGVSSCFTSERSLITVKCREPCVIMSIQKDTFATLMSEYPLAIVKCLKSVMSMVSPIVHLLNWNSDWIHIDGGDRIVHKGDKCDSLYIVLNGRLRATYGRSISGVEEIVEELGRGKHIGEIGGPTESWLCDIDAIRNSEIVKIPLVTLIAIIRACPVAGVTFARLISSKVQQKLCAQVKSSEHFSSSAKENRLSLPRTGITLSTISVVPLTSDINLSNFCSVLYSELNTIAPSKLVTKKEVRNEIGEELLKARGSMYDIKMTQYLGDLEENNRIVLYQADQKYTWWTKLCVQQADLILLVVNADKAPAKQVIEDCLIVAHNAIGVRVELVVIQNIESIDDSDQDEYNYDDDEKLTVSDQLNNWSEEREWITGYHLIRVPFRFHTLDFYRMCRRMTGLAVGLALGAGGARGLAHLGVIRALNEAGIVVDMVGGTSQGAYVGALFAKNPDKYETLHEESRQMALSLSSWKEKLLDLTLPITSIFSGRRFNFGIRKSFGKIRIQDLVLDFFCVSTDLQSKQMIVHTTGLLWKYVRASMTLATYLPPISDGSSLLVDGGYTNLVPADVMRSKGAKIVIAVDVSNEFHRDYYNYGLHLNGWWLLLNSIWPFTETVKVPSMTDINDMILWVSVNQHRKEMIGLTDLHLTPPIGKYGTLEYDKFDEIVQKGYEYAKPIIDEWAKQHPEYVGQRRLK